MLVYFPVVVGVVALVGLVVYFWRQIGPRSGRAFGNRIAAHIGMPRNVFHGLLGHGTGGSSHELLASLESLSLTLDEASVELGPILNRGIERSEARFGAQEMYDRVKPIVARLIAEPESRE